MTFAGQPRLGRLLVGTGVVDGARSFDGLGLEHLFSDGPLPDPLRDHLQRFDGVLSWFGSMAERFTERLRSAARETLIASPTPLAGSPMPVWRHLLDSVAPWTGSSGEPIEPLAVPEDWRRMAHGPLEQAGRRGDRALLVVHPGAGGAWKLWPPSSFAEVIREVVVRTGCQVLVHRGPADLEAAERLVGLLEHENLLWLVEPELDWLAGALVEADAYLGGDAGVSHLAAGVGAHAVIVFPSATFQGWAPWSTTAIPLSAEDAGTPRAAITALAQRLGSRR